MNREQQDAPSAVYLKLAIRYLARRDRTRVQVARHLQSKGASSAQRRAVVTQLVQLGYLNDEAFAARWADARLSRKPVGRARLKAELDAQGVAEQIVERVLETAYRRSGERALAEQVVRHEQAVRPAVNRRRLVRLLQQRGFDDETIRATLKLETDDGV